jgi:hypothetical protein
LKKLSIPSLGKPSKKKRIDVVDIVAAGISLILAVISVASESVLWRLGQGRLGYDPGSD